MNGFLLKIVYNKGKGMIEMILRITAEEIETMLKGFFGKIAKFFIKIFDAIIGAFDKYLPHEITIVVLIVVVAFVAIYIFTQKINK